MMKFIKYLLLLLATQTMAQVNLPQFSEPTSLTQKVGNTTFNIQYERPKMNDRVIYGGLVPYNQIWRTGAGECTKISFDTDIYIENEKIEAGKYSIFTIPSEDKEWTIILNKDTTLYGSYYYTEALDVIRFKSKPIISNHWAEAFSITMDVVNDKGRVHIHWGEVLVSFDLETRTYDNLRKQIKDILSNDYDLAKHTYSNVADYIILNRSGFGEDYLELASQLVDKAFLTEAKSGFNFRLKRDILKLQNNKEEYMKVSLEELEWLEKEKPYEGYELSIKQVKEAMKNYKE
jgi:hypothetical protein